MKVALVGSAPSSVALAPFQDKSFAEYAQGKLPDYPESKWINEEWQIWGCSPGAWPACQRATRWYELHRWEPGAPWLSPQYVEFLRRFQGIVYTGGEIPEIPNHRVYPIDEVEQEFSSYFLTSSLSLMCALAILEIEELRKNPEHNPDDDVIGFFGVDMAASEEWHFQRPGCHFFILQAIERGIGIYVPPESDLLRPQPVYGLCEWRHDYIKLTQRSRELNARLQQRHREVEQANADVRFVQGALDDLNYMVSTWTSPYSLPAGQVIRKKRGPG